jgi:hypothetical protein
MLKPLLLATTTIVQLAIVSTSTLQIAHATIIVTPSSTHLDRSIANGDRTNHINAQQQSDVNGIHATLTQFYGGMNEYNVDRMARVATPTTEDKKQAMRQSFARAKAAGMDISFQIKNIELVSLSDRQATVKIEQLVTGKKDGNTKSDLQAVSITLVKYRGSWKVGDFKPMSR